VPTNARNELLVLDMTNFATYIDTANTRAPIAQRGHAKQKRTDPRLVGLGLIVSTDHAIPLLSHTYDGSRPEGGASVQRPSCETASWSLDSSIRMLLRAAHVGIGRSDRGAVRYRTGAAAQNAGSVRCQVARP
jgi:hypothetical protein